MKRYLYKRFFDLLLAFFGMLVFLPLFILFSYLIWNEDRGGVFYVQTRVGKDKKEFKMLKFRSMTADSKEVATSSLKKGDSRITATRIGGFLRMSAMDELPQLINIFKGEMSFVGPRPLLPCEARSLEPAVFSVRSRVVPGLTGLAQINLDKFVPNYSKLEYDLKYIKRQSLWLDIQIISRSVIKTLKSEWEKKW